MCFTRVTEFSWSPASKVGHLLIHEASRHTGSECSVRLNPELLDNFLIEFESETGPVRHLDSSILREFESRYEEIGYRS